MSGCSVAATSAPRRVALPLPHHRPFSLAYFLLASVLLSLACVPYCVVAVVYTTGVSAANLPAVYTSVPSNPVAGLYQACVTTTNSTATAVDRMALTIRNTAMSAYVGQEVGTGTYYIAGYYDVTTDGWYWNDGQSGTTTQFGQGPTCTPVSSQLALNWATGYPKMGSGTAVGSLKYMVYNGTLKAWMNVAGTVAYDGVVCESEDTIVKTKKKFPWWAILIIVLGSVVVIAVVVTIVVCCCCKKKKDHYDDDGESNSDDDTSSSDSDTESKSVQSSRSGASSFARSRNARSFSSGGSSYSTASKNSSFTGTTESDSYSYSSSSSSSGSPTSSYSSGSRSRASSSRSSMSSRATSDTASTSSSDSEPISRLSF